MQNLYMCSVDDTWDGSYVQRITWFVECIRVSYNPFRIRR